MDSVGGDNDGPDGKSKSTAARNVTTEDKSSTGMILQELGRINRSLERMKHETDHEIKKLGTHIVSLEAELPEAEQYRLDGKEIDASNQMRLRNPYTSTSSLPFTTVEKTREEKEKELNAIFESAQEQAFIAHAVATKPNHERYDAPENVHPTNNHKFIVKGVTYKKPIRFIWSQDDRAMCWGWIPIWEEGAWKTAIELSTLTMVAVSVLVIVIQSYKKYDPERCDTDVFKVTSEYSLDEVYEKVTQNFPWGTTTTTTTMATAVCIDSASWIKNGKSARMCGWVAENPTARCGSVGDDGAIAGESCLVSCNTCGAANGTPPECEDPQLERELYTVQLMLVVWFSVEYVIRWISVRPHWKVPRPYTRKDFFKAKWAYTLSFMPLIDLLSILPFFLTMALGKSGGAIGNLLMILKVVRILRIFKLTKNNRTLTDVLACLTKITGDLVVFFVVIFTLAILISTCMFFVEKGNPEGWFATIPECFYWSVITFTSVGYGDRYPVSDAGRVVAAVASLAGTILMNFPIALIILSFDEVYNIRKQREERASNVVKKLFKWSTRHKVQDNVEHNELETVPEDERPRPAKKWFRRRKQKVVTYGQFYKRRAIQNRKARAKGMKDMKDLILNPHRRYKKVGTGVYNGRDHFLASKYSTKWVKATCTGRERREEEYFAFKLKRQQQIGTHKVSDRPQRKSSKFGTEQSFKDATLASPKAGSATTGSVDNKPTRKHSVSQKIQTEEHDFYMGPEEASSA